MDRDGVIYIGGENIVSPLGNSAEENFRRCLNGEKALQKQSVFEEENDVCCGVINEMGLTDSKASSKLLKAVSISLTEVLGETFGQHSGKTVLILCTTKGEIDALEHYEDEAYLHHLGDKIKALFSFDIDVMVVSVACISGVEGAIIAHDYIKTGRYETAVVVGADLFSQFTLKGFQSFYALSGDYVQPFDKDRKGLNLGEAASVVVLSKHQRVFKEKSFVFCGGATANDANHISGPSRTGEGLYRSIDKALKQSKVSKEKIDFISAHGTGTKYNDEMEAIAFNRHNFNTIPVNSLKGYFGHTLGAAGVLEIAMCLQMMRNETILKSMGYQEGDGTIKDIAVAEKNIETPLNYLLKTASGFGGCNAVVIIKRDSND